MRRRAYIRYLEREFEQELLDYEKKLEEEHHEMEYSVDLDIQDGCQELSPRNKFRNR